MDENEAKKPILILNMDINKTILMSDPAAQKDFADILTQILAEVTWGVSDGKTWTAKVNEPSLVNPKPNEYVSFFDHAEIVYGKFQSNKIEKRNLIRTFLTEGGPGYQFRSLFDELLSQMTVPPQFREQLGENMSIPLSFFNLIQHLVETNREFYLIFRTFGHDIEKIANLWNMFCDGKHPYYPNILLNESSTRNLKLKIPESYGVFYRHGPLTNDIHLIPHTIEAAPKKEGLSFYSPQQLESKITTFKEIHHYIHQAVKKHQTLALRDYYEWWAENNEHYTTGKLFLVDNKNKEYHHLFFDDNICIDEFEKDNNLIVDARDAETEQSVPPQTILNINLVKAEPFEIIRNRNWFIEQLKICEENYSKMHSNKN